MTCAIKNMFSKCVNVVACVANTNTVLADGLRNQEYSFRLAAVATDFAPRISVPFVRVMPRSFCAEQVAVILCIYAWGVC